MSEKPLQPLETTSEYEHTVDGYAEILTELQSTEVALAADYGWWAGQNREALEAAAEPHLANMNAQRPATAGTLKAANCDSRFLAGLTRPNWSEQLPKDDSKEEAERWQAFKAGFTPGMQVNLDALQELHGKITVLKQDETLQADFHDARGEHITDLRAAAKWRSIDRKLASGSQEIAQVRLDAGRSGRPLTAAETRHIKQLQEAQANLTTSRREITITPGVKAAIWQAQARDRRQQLERGLLRTTQMDRIVTEALPALSRGEPALFVGETGGAKTALAEHIAKQYFGTDPELVSGYGDVNSYQLMGKQELRNDNGVTVSEFTPGPIVRAMESGRPLILDEINAMPAELLKRLNKIMQLRPGDSFTIQEDSGRMVTVQPGFCIIATANEKSKRYKGVEDLSTDFQNRFGANVYRVRYPDHDVPYGDLPTENSHLVQAAVVDKSGAYPPDIDKNELFNFVRACHVSQQVFSGNFGEGFDNYRSSERAADNKPGLEETVLAPRTMVGILRDVVNSYGVVTLDTALRRFVDGIKNPNDQAVMRSILDSHGFLKDK